tara:strand:+ start:5753 stop:6763 length:1011 start_codon:yes stop_codon:yes gene_type:complete
MSVITRNLMMAAGQGSGPADHVFVVFTDKIIAFNVTDPANPTITSSLTYDGFIYLKSDIVYSAKTKHVFATSWVPDIGIVAIDVSDPSAMSVSSEYVMTEPPTGLALDDAHGRLYSIDEGSVVRKLNVTNPSSISQATANTLSYSFYDHGNGDICLDLINRRVFVSQYSTRDPETYANPYLYTYYLLNDSLTELDDYEYSRPTAIDSYQLNYLNPKTKTAYATANILSSYAFDYSGDTLGGPSEAGADYTSSLSQLYFRSRDDYNFGVQSRPNFIAHDDYRLISFRAASGTFYCVSTAYPDSPVTLGSVDYSAITTETYGSAIANVSGPAATYGYR